MTRDDLDSSDLPASGDVTPVWDDGERTKSATAGPADAHTQHLASVTSHHIVASTMPTDAIAIQGQIYSVFRQRQYSKRNLRPL